MNAIVSRLPATWRHFGQFLRQPALDQPTGLLNRTGWLTTGTMLTLHLLGLVVLLLLLSGWQALTGVGGPAAFEEFPKQWLVPTAVIAAPILEEAAFRGWLSGRPRALLLLGGLVVAAASLLLWPKPGAALAVGLIGGLVVLLAGWIALRKRPAPLWFGRNFAAIFYASVAVFGLVHVFNYTNTGPLVLPMILPQVWAGLTLGFVRTRVGLAASMLMHGASNGLALALVALGG